MTPQDLVARNVQLVSLPELCLEVQAMADSPYATATDLGELIAKDTALSARLLRLVNSAYFGLAGRVDTLSRAVNLIGMRELRNLTLAASATDIFSAIDSRQIDMAAFWQHSVYCGLVARHLAAHANVLHSERLFTAGLLHDVGRLLMLMKMPGEMDSVLTRFRETGGDICALERAAVGFDHAEAGGALLAHWNLPANLCASVRWHHDPSGADDAALEVAILYLADRIAHAAQAHWKPENSNIVDPFRAFLNADLHAEEIATIALNQADPDAVSRSRSDTASAANAIRQATVAFDQVLDLLYPYMAPA